MSERAVPAGVDLRSHGLLASIYEQEAVRLLFAGGADPAVHGPGQAASNFRESFFHLSQLAKAGVDHPVVSDLMLARLSPGSFSCAWVLSFRLRVAARIAGLVSMDSRLLRGGAVRPGSGDELLASALDVLLGRWTTAPPGPEELLRSYPRIVGRHDPVGWLSNFEDSVEPEPLAALLNLVVACCRYRAGPIPVPEEKRKYSLRERAVLEGSDDPPVPVRVCGVGGHSAQ